MPRRKWTSEEARAAGLKGAAAIKGKPRRKLAQKLSDLADEAATTVLTQDLGIVVAGQPVAGMESDSPTVPTGQAPTPKAVAEAKERIVKLCRGRIPTKIEHSGDEGEPIQFVILRRPASADASE